MSTIIGTFQESSPGSTMKFPEIVHEPLEMPREFSWGYWEIVHIAIEFLWSYWEISRIVHHPGKFQENSHEPIDKFPEIVHYPWEIPNEFPCAYWEIPRNCPLALCNLQRIHLSLLRNSQKLFTTPGKFEENSPMSSETFPLSILRHSYTMGVPKFRWGQNFDLYGSLYFK